ncbi:MAG: DUF3160 domain-containing protein, partial [Candidatus Heimdallarchaeota archaeon]|nr:DUF3160 domain-containing protein [Candidatus Heimdallarchaeota archaeon]MCK4876912.1 DUF3160 domain-containing protein [Candidatus Heimdallarchaeota archaeon]
MGIITFLIVSSLAISIPLLTRKTAPHGIPDGSIIPGTAAAFQIDGVVNTAFGSYTPSQLEYTPSIKATAIKSNLANVDLQDLDITPEVKSMLEQYGFALVDEGYEDIYQLYEGNNDEGPHFVTTDLCLHAYHVLYDITLRILEGESFFYDFEQMLIALRDAQTALNTTVSEPVVHDAINKNVAYLSVMLYLLNDTNTIPSEVEAMTNEELAKIDAGEIDYSAIFGYEEDYTQYTIRGHYTRNDLLGNYFKAMMYAGRISYLLQSPSGDPAMGIEHTRMALLLVSSFDTSMGPDTVWDYWDKIYEPTVFYVGASDDLTAAEYYEIWQDEGSPEGDDLAEESVITSFIDVAKTYRKPQINSMFIYEAFEHENVTQGFRLMGQRFIPDSYIFQQLVHTKVGGRLFPNGLDIFSVFGSTRAAYYMQSENESYSNYNDQIWKLREEFGGLTEYDWTQNLYWMWLYSLFPLLRPAIEGYPGFMLSDAWTDKSLMTTLSSWAELRHDTILYAKQSYTPKLGIPEMKYGYVEPYPELYSRLSSLVRLMSDGLNSRGLLLDRFDTKLLGLANIFDNLTVISIKELENEPLTEDEYRYIRGAGETIAKYATFNDPDADPWTSETDDRMAVIADVHTDPNTGKVLEVGSGDP